LFKEYVDFLALFAREGVSSSSVGPALARERCSEMTAAGDGALVGWDVSILASSICVAELRDSDPSAQ
jgi:hypothetical protein